MINELAKKIHQNAIDKGFFERERNIGEMLCLIHSEVSEALEADRKNHYADNRRILKLISEKYTWQDSELSFSGAFEKDVKNSFEDELADVMIRVMDLAAFKNVDLEYHIKMKMEYNALRQKYHGKKY